jgi:hypothetical protein
VQAAGRHVQIVDDRSDHVGALDRFRNPMVVVDEEPEAEHDERPARNQRDLRDERRPRILMRDQEDEAVHERAHEQANRDLGDPVLQEPIERAGQTVQNIARLLGQRNRFRRASCFHVAVRACSRATPTNAITLPPPSLSSSIAPTRPCFALVF